ncbi:hypothetical protein Acr_10g0000380 [Actinidia rufa]|uniref:Prolamin-like domain-containing protein n=1 Tax=Actinidia rufa TaxID=165716 RepID=A0A7J0F7U2_9ERIC|nr:hypothetical protein Acr_10g0000380 [Actinidia rufa]
MKRGYAIAAVLLACIGMCLAVEASNSPPQSNALDWFSDVIGRFWPPFQSPPANQKPTPSPPISKKPPPQFYNPISCAEHYVTLGLCIADLYVSGANSVTQECCNTIREINKHCSDNALNDDYFKSIQNACH